MAQLTLTANEHVGLYSGTYSMFGTTQGHEVVAVTSGTVTFDASFNAGGDDLELSGNAGDYSVSRAGAVVTLHDKNNHTQVAVPVGKVGMTIGFADESLKLVIADLTQGIVKIGNQVITSTDIAIVGTGASHSLPLDTDTTILAGDPLYAGFSTLTLGSERDEDAKDGHQYNIALNDANRPIVGGALTINGAALAADTDGAGPLTAETMNIDGAGVTTFSLVLTGGAAGDTFRLGALSNSAASGGGDDIIYLGAGVDALDAGAGIDTIIATTRLDASDHVDGGADLDSLSIGGRDYVDADFGGVSNIERLLVSTAGMSVTLGANAQAGGLTAILNTSPGLVTVDFSGYSAAVSYIGGAGSDFVTGGAGADTFDGGGGADVFKGGAGKDTFVYNALSDSSGLSADTIRDFTSGVDVISIAGMAHDQPQLAGEKIVFDGNFLLGAGHAVAGDKKVDALFSTSDHLLWFDLNDDGVFDDHDLSISMPTVSKLAGADVGAGSILSPTLILDADTNLAAGNSVIKGVDKVVLGTGRDQAGDDGHQYFITLNNTNGPLAGGVLTIDGSALVADMDGAGPLVDERVILDAGAVTTYHLALTTGAGADVVYLTDQGDVVSTGAGDDGIALGTGGHARIDTGAGDDDVSDGSAGLFDDTVTIDGGLGTDTLDLLRPSYTDAAFAHVTNVEKISLDRDGSPNTITLGPLAKAAGVTSVYTFDRFEGVAHIDASAFDAGTVGLDIAGTVYNDTLIGGAGINHITGYEGADTLTGGAGADTFIYVNLKDSSFDSPDTITDFVSGQDVIDITHLGDNYSPVFGQQIVFAGNAANFDAAVALFVAGDHKVQAVFNTATHLLMFDIDDDAVYSDAEPGIILAGVSSLIGADVLAGATVTGIRTTLVLDATTDVLPSDHSLIGYDTILLRTGRDDPGFAHTYRFDLENYNATPLHGTVLTIDGSGLAGGINSEDGPAVNERVNVNASDVSDYSLAVITGAGDDFVVLGKQGGVVSTGDGADTIFLGGGHTLIDAGAGDDRIQDQPSGVLSSAVTIDGGLGTDTLYLLSAANTDADFAHVTHVERISLEREGSPNTITLGPLAKAAGITAVYVGAQDDGVVYIDASAFDAGGVGLTLGGTLHNDRLVGGAGINRIIGYHGADTLTGGTGGDTFIYLDPLDSSYDNPDTITDFVSGQDVIDITHIGGADAQAVGEQIVFAGNAANFDAAVALFVAGDHKAQVVFNTATHLLMFDLDDTAFYSDSQLGIYLTGVSSLTAVDVQSGSVIGA